MIACLLAMMKASLEKMEASQEKVETKMEACPVRKEAKQEKLEATDLQANTEEIEIVAEHRQVSKQEAAVKTMGALEDRYRDQSLAVRWCGLPKKRTEDNDGSRQKLAATHGLLTRRAVPALHKRRSCRGPGRHPATGLEDEAADRSYVWEARRHSLRPADKLSIGDCEASSRVFHWAVENE
jgi:hypothetical protein